MSFPPMAVMPPGDVYSAPRYYNPGGYSASPVYSGNFVPRPFQQGQPMAPVAGSGATKKQLRAARAAFYETLNGKSGKQDSEQGKKKSKPKKEQPSPAELIKALNSLKVEDMSSVPVASLEKVVKKLETVNPTSDENISDVIDKILKERNFMPPIAAALKAAIMGRHSQLHMYYLDAHHGSGTRAETDVFFFMEVRVPQLFKTAPYYSMQPSDFKLPEFKTRDNYTGAKIQAERLMHRYESAGNEVGDVYTGFFPKK